MTVLLLALLIGVVAGLRGMTAPAVVSWAAHLGALHLGGTWLAFLGHAVTPWILTVLGIGNPMAPWRVSLRLAAAVNWGFWAESP